MKIEDVNLSSLLHELDQVDAYLRLAERHLPKLLDDVLVFQFEAARFYLGSLRKRVYGFHNSAKASNHTPPTRPQAPAGDDTTKEQSP